MSAAPTTDCPTCGRTARECNESHAKGWDGCCMTCDHVGRRTAHSLRLTEVAAEACSAQYGHNPDLCYYPAGHTGPHGNRYGCTWER